MLTNEYLKRVYDTVLTRNPGESEFHQAVLEVLESLESVVEQHPEYEANGIMERFVEPERFISSPCPGLTTAARVRVNRGFRVQFNSAIGPYKGGLRFHRALRPASSSSSALSRPSRTASPPSPWAAARAAPTSTPKGKSDGEVMRFCQSFMNELYKHIGQFTDIPAGDIGVGAREVGYMFGQYKRLTGTFQGGTITGKGIPFGGSLARTQATGYGLCYFAEEALKCMRTTPSRARPSSSPAAATSPPTRREVHAARRQGRRDVRLQRLYLRSQGVRPQEDYGHQAEAPRAHQGLRRRGPRQRVSRGLPRHLDRQVRHRPALRHAERDGPRGREGPYRQRLHGRLRGREHAADARGHRRRPGRRPDVQPRQGLQRRRRRHQRP